jgi:hypothetical protein
MKQPKQIWILKSVYQDGLKEIEILDYFSTKAKAERMKKAMELVGTIDGLCYDQFMYADVYSKDIN